MMIMHIPTATRAARPQIAGTKKPAQVPDKRAATRERSAAPDQNPATSAGRYCREGAPPRAESGDFRP